MYSLSTNIENTIEIKKSKFITKLYKINNIDEINEILNKTSEKYNDATHICYAYILKDIVKCSDNGEPSGTAGMPMLNVLQKNNLTNVLAIVIRYFGGIKLGAGGLVRAYSNAVIEALNLTDIIYFEEGYLLDIEFDYENKKIIESILNNYNIVDRKYENIIKYKLEIKSNDFESLKNDLINFNVNINIIKKILIK